MSTITTDTAVFTQSAIEAAGKAYQDVCEAAGIEALSDTLEKKA